MTAAVDISKRTAQVQ